MAVTIHEPADDVTTEQPMQALVLRPALASDVGGIVELLNRAYRGDASREGWTTEADLLDGQRTDRADIESVLADPHARLIVLTDGTHILGNVQVRRHGDAAYIGMLAVNPRLQSRGFGGRLLTEAERVAAHELRARDARLWVLSVRNDLIPWYRRKGYELSAARLPFPHETERFGRPKRPDLEFRELVKPLTGGPSSL